MQNTDEYENALDVAFVNDEFQQFLRDYANRGGSTSGITEPLLKAYGASKTSILAALLYGFVAGMNAGAAYLNDEAEKED